MPRSSLSRVLLILVVIEAASLVLGISSLLAREGERYALTAFFSLGAAVVTAVVLVFVVWQLVRARSRPLRVMDRPDQARAESSAVIEFERPLSEGSDVLRTYGVLIDGVQTADLRLGERVRVTVKPGNHKLAASVAGEMSPPTEVDVAADQQVHVEVIPTPGNAAQRRQTGWLQLRASRL